MKRNSIDSGRAKSDGGSSTNSVITIAMNNIDDVDVDVQKKKNVHKFQTFRRIFAQFLASSIKNLLILDGGITMAFPTIVIPALTGLNQQINPDEFLHITPVQASWLAAISFVGQPLGSAISGMITEPFGRKKALFLVNIPHVIAWLMLYRADNLTMIFIGFAILGLDLGLMEAPIITYLGEICEPSTRGPLTAIAGIAATSGIFLAFFYGILVPWRIAALISCSIPILTMIAVCFIPETPIWLLARGRDEDAMKSLQWLRGWVSPACVVNEFNDLKRYKELSNACSSCEKLSVKCPHPPPTLGDKLRDVLRKRTMTPFTLIAIMFFIMQFSGMFAMRPYIVQILEAFGMPMDANLATVVLGLIGIVANFGLLAFVRVFGKRRIYLFSTFATCVSCFGLSVYGYKYFPPGWTSFEKHNTTFVAGDQQVIINDVVGNYSYVALGLFVLMQFATSIGVSSVPNMMLSEVFPFKSRAFTSGTCKGVNYLLAFVASKTYYDLEMAFTLPGVIFFYGVMGALGVIVMYFFLPETENRSLEDIEHFFSDRSRKITDITIHKNAAREHYLAKQKALEASEVKHQT